MKTIDSDALAIVNRALGLTGAGAPVTEFPDGTLDQVLDVSALVRRGRTQAATQGIYGAVLRSVHGAADSNAVTVDPYEVGTTAVIAPYPNPMPPAFEVWLLGGSVRRVSGTGTLTAVLTMTFPAVNQGWGIDNNGVAVLVEAEHPLVFWDASASEGITFGLRNGTRGPFQRIGTRVPRGSNLRLRSTSTALSTWDCSLILGVFPVGLGQDVVV